MRLPLEYQPVTGTRTRPAFRARLLVTAALCALVLLTRASGPTSAAETKPLTAILLIARDELQPPDTDFGESIVLVMNNVGPAPVGVIVNKPTPIPVARLFPDLKRLAPLPDKVYYGGPVEFGTVWYLFRAAKSPSEHAVQALEGIYLSADRALLLQLLGRDKPMEGLRIFLGHSGWAPGQLEAEIARGAWNLGRAESDVIFNGKSEHPWPPPQPRRPASSA